MPTIKLRFVTSNDTVSNLIRQITDFPYSHVEFVLDEDWHVYLAENIVTLPKAVGNGPLEAMDTLGAHLDGGFMLRTLNYATFTAIEYVTIDVTAEQKQALIALACNCIGQPYDVLEIAGILFHQNWAETGHWICSRVCATLLIKSAVDVLRIPEPKLLDSITPRDLYLSPLLTTVAA